MALELAEIFRAYGLAYRQKYAEHLLPSHRQAMHAIEQCRTETLDAAVFECSNCGEMRYSYHSYRNRHCPKCQHQQTQDWLELQRRLLLNAPYFMLTFTLPSELRQLASRNQRLFYGLLFQASAQATQKLALDPRFIGGQIGLIGVLHTWTRNLAFHPHVHYLAPGGRLAPNGIWLPARYGFFLPVKVLSRLFRAAFLSALKKHFVYSQIPPAVWQKAWVVHCKPVGDGQAALKYLAPYIHRVAISNRRLLALEHRGSLETSQVTFLYRPSDTDQVRRSSLSVEQFIHRFLQHILPQGFVKVRYFGLFAPTQRSKLESLQQQRGSAQPQNQEQPASSTQDNPSPPCPKCGAPLRFLRDLPPLLSRSP